MKTLLSLILPVLCFAGFTDRLMESATEDQKSIILEMEDAHYVKKLGDDAKWRPVFVSLQGKTEQLLAKLLEEGKVEDLIGIIHTPTPTTPLCKKPTAPVPETLVDQSMRNDQARLQTVQDRSVILRRFLNANSQLYIAYPKGGLEKRSLEQQAVYKEERENRANLNEVILNSAVPADFIGATYVFKYNGEEHFFAIRARQANAPDDSQPWEMWFGLLSSNPCQTRYYETMEWLKTNATEPFRLFLR